MDVLIPSEEDMARLVEARFEHSKECEGHPFFDLSNIAITLRCRACGWSYVIELESN